MIFNRCLYLFDSIQLFRKQLERKKLAKNKSIICIIQITIRIMYIDVFILTQKFIYLIIRSKTEKKFSLSNRKVLLEDLRNWKGNDYSLICILNIEIYIKNVPCSYTKFFKFKSFIFSQFLHHFVLFHWISSHHF
jgi:hypothetical protein